MINEHHYPVSFFPALSSLEPSVINFDAFIDTVRSGCWRQHTERYRQLLAEGNKSAAAAVKRQSPGITPSGVFTGGHKAEHFKEPSGLLCLDYDHCASQLEHIREVGMRMPETVGIFTSLSGTGLKVFVSIPEIDKEQYRSIYRMVMNRYNRLTGVAADRSCKDICRLCFVSYDPRAWYNPEATPFVPVTASLDLHLYLDEGEEKYPFTEGMRNSNLLKLLRSAARRGFSDEELLQVSLERYLQPGFEEEEITKILASAWGYAQQEEGLEKEDLGLKKGQLSSINPNTPPEYDPEEWERDEEYRSQAPRFSQEYIDNPPDIIRESLKAACSDAQRDMLLMGDLAVLSGCIPNVKFVYSHKNYSPHFYFFGVAHAGTGKGIVENAAHLAGPLHKWYDDQGEELVKKYEDEKFEWEQELLQASKEKRKPNRDKRPEEPRVVSLLIPGNASKIRHLIHLRNNHKLGGIIHCTEADDLTMAIAQDCGQQQNLLRNIFHHEPVSSSHKANGSPIRITRPKLAICITGTPAQLVRLIPHTEDGLYSRFLLLTQGTSFEWISPEPVEGKENHDALFARLGEEVLEMHRALLASPTQVHFTRSQWKRHSSFFREKLKRVALENKPYASAIVYRHGLIVMRVAAVLTVLRKWEERYFMPDRYCSDGDFDMALHLVGTALEHSLLLSSSLPNLTTKVAPLRPFDKLLNFLELMPEKFTYSEMAEISKKAGIPLSTAKYNLKKAVEAKLLKHSGKFYIKIKSGGI